MVSCFEYLVSLIGSFIDTLDGLTVIAGFSLLDLIIALIIITLVIDVFDDSTSEDIERAVSAGFDSNGIDCIYNVEEREDD